MSGMLSRRALALTWLVALAASPAVAAEAKPPIVAAAQDAAVTQVNLLEQERFWPYRVALPEPWLPPGAEEPLRRNEVGVLIRVEESGGARIDFGGRGKYVVPIERTDLLDRANAIRLGQRAKEWPNFVQAIRTRMLDGAAERLVPLPVEVPDGSPAFLCAFGDPSEPGFDDLVAAIAPLRDRPGLLTIFFPLGRHGDARMRARLHELDWKVPFLPDFLSEGYTRSLLDEDTPLPALLLQTSEGRVIFQGPWGLEQGEAFARALAQLPAPIASTAAR